MTTPPDPPFQGPPPPQGPPPEEPRHRGQHYRPYEGPMPYPGTPDPTPKQGGIVAAFAVAGAALFIVVNAVFGFVVFVAVANTANTANSGNSYPVILGVAAAVSALAAFGGGAALIMLRKPVTKGLGLGLMIGWALVSISTAGFCTGLNPHLYSAPPPHDAATGHSTAVTENGAHP
ncbi:hypothetical protein IU449_02890 [Nocardia higoensis]|uniref:DUF4064 domain-containing protein n=1 Tax=Nocardia higoensis TaxID=228599 RepID=A0ABS0D9R5_9NOCA|nr:hypothetical protein [Nocardia higoensis]MBF6353503.1 hypothetical protein [Nocardia higoensis]